MGRSASQVVSLSEIVVPDPVAVKQFVHIGGEEQAAALPVTSHLRWAVATFFAEIVEVIYELLALHSQGVARRHRGDTQSPAPLSVIHHCHQPIGGQISPEMPKQPCLVVALQLSSAAEAVRRGVQAPALHRHQLGGVAGGALHHLERQEAQPGPAGHLAAQGSGGCALPPVEAK